MKVICMDGTIDLSNFDKVYYKVSILGSGNGYSVKAEKQVASGGLFGSIQTITEEITRLTNEDDAKKLVEDITDAWINEEKFFNVKKWSEKYNSNFKK